MSRVQTRITLDIHLLRSSTTTTSSPSSSTPATSTQPSPSYSTTLHPLDHHIFSPTSTEKSPSRPSMLNLAASLPLPSLLACPCDVS
ncbi:hypothetical protein Mapa_005980 [Marchantia paleacea]|nr:hypothetical protein Mapa_005980 [Marchantia paleacea]